MANHRSAEKRHRQALKRQARNKHWRSTIRHAIREVRTAADSGAKDAGDKLSKAERLLRKGVTKGVVHTRTASRTISRLHKLVHS